MSEDPMTAEFDALNQRMEKGLSAIHDLVTGITSVPRAENAALQREIDQLKRDVESVAKTLRDGNGTSVISRLAVLERDINHLQSTYGLKNDRGWQLTLTLVSSLAALMTIVADILLRHSVK
jgi:hypothetical protein